jgi:nucleotide-binding universal stress UspA family protein
MAILQIATIIASRGDVYLLGEAYAFGVVWSFFLKALGCQVLRFQRHDQEYKVPLNIRLGRWEIPVGLGSITSVLFLVALANLFSKKVATIYGIGFTVFLFVLFLVSERVNAGKRRESGEGELEKFNLENQIEAIHAKPGCVLVAVRDFKRLYHLERVLEKTNIRRHDVVVATVRVLSTGSGEFELRDDQIFGEYEQELFSRVVSVAEKQGKPVELLVIPASDPMDALVEMAARLQVSRLVVGVSARMSSAEWAKRVGESWEKLPEPRHPFSLEITSPDRPTVYVNLGPHPPRLWPEDLDRLHRLWLMLSNDQGLGSRLHHRDVVGTALERLERDLQGGERAEVIAALRGEVEKMRVEA